MTDFLRRSGCAGAGPLHAANSKKQSDKNTRWENDTHLDWDYQPGDKVLLHKDGILPKTESRYESDPWTITSVHTNGTIRVQL
jgi:hypothetical protein